MISCTEFIFAYSELFKHLDRRGGPEAVERFWEFLSDEFLGNLRDLAAAKGLAGCFEYWQQTLGEEAADFQMTCDEENNLFEIIMRHCPSKGRLLATDHLAAYPDYCRHCDILYRRVLEPLGFTYDIDLSQSDRARCHIRIRKLEA